MLRLRRGRSHRRMPTCGVPSARSQGAVTWLGRAGPLRRRRPAPGEGSLVPRLELAREGRLCFLLVPAWLSLRGCPCVAGPAWPCVAVSAWLSLRGWPRVAVPAWLSPRGRPCVAVPAWPSLWGCPHVAVPAGLSLWWGGHELAPQSVSGKQGRERRGDAPRPALPPLSPTSLCPCGRPCDGGGSGKDGSVPGRRTQGRWRAAATHHVPQAPRPVRCPCRVREAFLRRMVRFKKSHWSKRAEPASQLTARGQVF